MIGTFELQGLGEPAQAQVQEGSKEVVPTNQEVQEILQEGKGLLQQVPRG